jgi:cytoskeleton protein RodZ
LKFVFDKESWVEVRDGHGHRLMRQLNPAGSQQTVDGVPPLSVVVGNAGSVHLELNHQPVDLVPHTEIDVARLTLE